MAPELFHEPTPRFLLGGPGGLIDRDPQIFDLALDLLARQEIEPAHQDRGFDHGGLGAIEAFERRMRDAVHDATVESRALLVLSDARHRELRVRQRRDKPRYRNLLGSRDGPVAASGQASGEDAYVVGV